MKKLAFSIGVATVLIAIVGIYFFQVQPQASNGAYQYYIQDFFTPLWSFIEGLANVLKTVWDWFSRLIGFVGNILPQGG